MSLICAGMVSRELKQHGDAKTKGEQLFRDHGFTGARGEAESGFMTVRRYGLPVWEKAIASGYSPEESLLRVLLSFIAHNPDTNILSRGGLMGCAMPDGMRPDFCVLNILPATGSGRLFLIWTRRLSPEI
jgi:triphosphoribosyl-dephospho-CoA synthase